MPKPEELVDYPTEPHIFLKFHAGIQEFCFQMFGSNNIQFKWEFNKFLPKPFPQYEECYIEVTLYPTSIKFLPNAPYTKWFGMRECLINETMIMHNGTQPLTGLQPDELDLLQTALYSLSVRSENICIVPLLPTFL